MCCFGIKVFAGKFEGKRASVGTFHKIGKTEFNQNYRPDRHNAAEHVDSADCSYGCKDTGCSHSLSKWISIYNINAVKNISMNGNYNCDECKDHSLKLISRHKTSLRNPALAALQGCNESQFWRSQNLQFKKLHSCNFLNILLEKRILNVPWSDLLEVLLQNVCRLH